MTALRVLVPVLILAIPCAPRSAPASECAGIRLPDVVEVAGTPLRLNGAGLRRVTFLLVEIDVYVAALYLQDPTRSASDVVDGAASSRLALHFRRAVPRTRLTEGFAEAFERAAPGDESLWERLERLNGWMQDMDAGDELSFDYLPGSGVVVTVEAERRGVVPGTEFARILLGNWLGPHAVDPRLEAGLLGAPCE